MRNKGRERAFKGTLFLVRGHCQSRDAKTMDDQKKGKLPRVPRGAGIGLVLLMALFPLFWASNSSGRAPTSHGEPEKISMNKHQVFAELSCRDCHEDEAPRPLSSKQCLSCHGSLEGVARTNKDLNPDPHNSPHYGTNLDCALCHHEHSKSENFCAQCHEWDLLVP